MIKAVIFDMDGLLIDSEPLWRKAEMEIFKTVGINLTEDDCKETMGYRLNEVVELWFKRFPWSGPTLVEIEESILNRVSELILAEGKILPGVKATIESCIKHQLKMAIASSSPMKLIKSVVQLLKMENAFDVLHSAQHEEFGKPHPGVFITTASKLGMAVNECLVLEDSFHGVIAALSAKMKVFAVPDSQQFSNPKFQAANKVFPSLEGVNLFQEIRRLT